MQMMLIYGVMLCSRHTYSAIVLIRLSPYLPVLSRLFFGELRCAHLISNQAAASLIRQTAQPLPLPVHRSEAHRILARIPLACLLYTSPSPRDRTRSRMPSSA